jgi:hypothetical protein
VIPSFRRALILPETSGPWMCKKFFRMPLSRFSSSLAFIETADIIKADYLLLVIPVRIGTRKGPHLFQRRRRQQIFIDMQKGFLL